MCDCDPTIPYWDFLTFSGSNFSASIDRDPTQRWESKSRVTFSAEKLQESHSLLEKSDANDSIDMCTACVRRSEKLLHLEKKQEVLIVVRSSLL